MPGGGVWSAQPARPGPVPVDLVPVDQVLQRATSTDPGPVGPGSVGPGSVGLGPVGPGSVGLGPVGPGSVGLGSVGPGSVGPGSVGPGPAARVRQDAEAMDPAAASGYLDPPARVGFFTDTSICIGCKACEVACKEWNGVPEDGLCLTGMSYDNTGGLSADTWRHVAFIEQRVPHGADRPDASAAASAGGAAAAGGDRGAGEAQGAVPIEGQLVVPRVAQGSTPVQGQQAVPAEAQGAAPVVAQPGLRWLMASDVCKHCTRAACLDVCPTGALFRTEFGTVVVQQDVCNGCGYCIPACPFGVIGQRSGDGRAWKCTLCYDRLTVGMEPACAKACPTQSIQFGVLDELRERADRRLVDLHRAGVSDARLYGRNPADGVGGGGAFMLLLDEPEVYGLPPDPVVTTADLAAMWRRVALAATALAAAGVAAFAGRRR